MIAAVVKYIEDHIVLIVDHHTYLYHYLQEIYFKVYFI